MKLLNIFQRNTDKTLRKSAATLQRVEFPKETVEYVFQLLKAEMVSQ